MSDRAPAQLQITATTAPDGVRRVAVAGELDLAVADDLRAEVCAQREDATEVVVDLARVTFMDSTGVGVLLALCRDSEADGWNVSFVASQAVWRVLGLCALQETLAVRLAS